eukprot:3107216-Pyramimonas_sp.AAC.1
MRSERRQPFLLFLAPISHVNAAALAAEMGGAANARTARPSFGDVAAVDRPRTHLLEIQRRALRSKAASSWGGEET